MRSRVILASLLVAIVNAAGCGGSSHEAVNPEAMLEAAAAHPISTADLEIDLRTKVRGVARLSEPLRLRLEGPYVSGGGERIPSFDWKFTASALGFPVGGQVVSTGTNAYLSVYGDNYEVGTDPVAQANQRLSAGGGTSTDLGLPPRHWFGRARLDGDGNAGGTDCERISAPLRGGAVARGLQSLASGLGLTETPAISGTATACVGYDDRTLHELELDMEVGIPAVDRSSLAGATSAHIDLDIVAGDVNEPQHISIPAGGGYRPIRDLALTLNDLGVPIPLG
jgi:hypothetical protein